MPFSTATRRTWATSMPPPSSMMVMTTWFDSWAAESSMVPVAVLPRATPLGRGLDAVVDAVADHVHEGLRDLVDDGLVHAGVLALDDQLHLLALALREVAHQAGEALEDRCGWGASGCP